MPLYSPALVSQVSEMAGGRHRREALLGWVVSPHGEAARLSCAASSPSAAWRSWGSGDHGKEALLAQSLSCPASSPVVAQRQGKQSWWPRGIRKASLPEILKSHYQSDQAILIFINQGTDIVEGSLMC